MPSCAKNDRPLDVSLLKPLPFFHVSHQQHQTWCRCCPDAVLWFAEVKTLTHHIYKGRIEYKLKKKKISERKKSFIYAVFHQHLPCHSSINCDVFTSDTISQCYRYSDTKLTMAMAIDFVIVEIYPLYSRHVFYVQRESRVSFFTMLIVFHIVNM